MFLTNWNGGVVAGGAKVLQKYSASTQQVLCKYSARLPGKMTLGIDVGVRAEYFSTKWLTTMYKLKIRQMLSRTPGCSEPLPEMLSRTPGCSEPLPEMLSGRRSLFRSADGRQCCRNDNKNRTCFIVASAAEMMAKKGHASWSPVLAK